MKKIFLYIAFFTQITQLVSQKEIWSIDVAKDAYMTQIETGQILVKENEKITLLDQIEGKVLWTTSVATDKDPIFLDDLPIFYFSGKSYAIIDAVTGKVIDKDAQKTDVLNVHYFWDKSKVILEQDRNGSLYITCLDLTNNKATTTKVAEIKKSMFGLVKNATHYAPSIANDGSIILVDKKAVTVIGNNGIVKHRTEFEEDLEKINFNEFNNFLYVREEKKLHFVNTNTGKIESTIKLEDEDFSFDIINEGNIFALRDGKKLSFLNSTNGEIVVNKKFDDKIKYTYFDNETNKYYLSIKKSILEIDQKTAETIRSAEVSKAIGQIYQVRDRMFMGDNYGSNEIDLSTFTPRYPTNIPLGIITDFLSCDNANLYINDKISMIYMIGKAGEVLWKKKFDKEVIQTVDLTPSGILLITDVKAYLFDVNTGKPIVKDEILTGPSMVFNLNEKTNLITFYSEKRLKMLNLNTGEFKQSKKPIAFKDFDYLTMRPHMSINEKYIYLKGSNSIIITDLDGNILHEKHYKSVDNASTLVTLAVVAISAASIATGNADKVVTVYSNNQQVHKGEYVDGLNSMSNYSNELAAKRKRQQNKSSAMFPYVHTKFENSKQHGLIFIDQETGNHKYEVNMTETNPNFIVDEIDGQLYYISSNKLTAYSLK